MWRQFKSGRRRFLRGRDVPGGTRTGEADGADDALSEDARDLCVPLRWGHGFGIVRGVHAGSANGGCGAARPLVALYAFAERTAHWVMRRSHLRLMCATAAADHPPAWL